MRVSFRAILYLWVGLIVIISGLLFHAYTNLKPETFIALLSEQVQKNYPGSDLEVGKVNYSFSLDFNLNPQNIHLRRSGKLLASVGKVELKVPWWLLIVNSGHAQINIIKLDIFIDNHKDHTIDKKKIVTKTKNIKVELPSYLANAKYTLRAKDVSIRDIHDERRYFTLSKLLVREFLYGKNSAFELNIPIEINHNDYHHTAELWLFGDVTPSINIWKLNFRGEFRTKESSEKFQMEDLVIAGSTQVRPDLFDVTSQMNLFIEKNQVGKGEITANRDSLKIDLSLKEFPINYFSIVYDEIKNPYLNRLEGNSEGTVYFEKNLSTNIASVSGKLNFDGDFVLSQNFSIPGKWQFSFQNSLWETSFISPKGETSFFRRSVLDINTRTVTQYNEELGFTELDLTQTLSSVVSLGDLLINNPDHYFHSSISYKDCYLKERVLNGIFRYGYSPDQKFYQANISEDKKTFSLNYSDKMIRKFNIKATNFLWDSSLAFMSPFFMTKNAIVDGSLDGEWQKAWHQGKWLGKLSVKEMDEVKGEAFDLIKMMLEQFTISAKEVRDVALDFSVSDNKINMKTLRFNNKENGKISGILSSGLKTKSYLSLTYPKNKKLRPEKKEVKENFWSKEVDL